MSQVLMKRSVWASIALAVLGSAAASMAQTTPTVPAAPDPAVGGQASTRTPAGVGNPTQTPDGTAPASREAVKSEARVHNRNNVTNSLPKGEATTTVNHQPNAIIPPAGEMSRSEVSQAARKVKPRFGDKGERPEVATNPSDKTGTPK